MLTLLASPAWAGPTTSPSGWTQKDALAVLTAYNRRTLVDAFNQDGHADTTLDEPARAFLDRAALRFSEAAFNEQYWADTDITNEAMLALAKPVEKLDHPLVLFCRAIFLNDAGQRDAGRALLAKAAPAVASGNYPAIRRLYASQIPSRQRRGEDPWEVTKPLAVEIATQKLNSPRERQVIAGILVNDFLKIGQPHDALDDRLYDRRRQFLDDLAANPAADAWLVAYLRGQNELFAAMKIHQRDPDKAMAAGDGSPFRQHLASSKTYFVDAYAREPEYVEAPAAMIQALNFDRDAADQSRAWFDKAKASQFDFYPAWMNYVTAIKTPGPAGLDQLQALLHEAVSSERFDTIVPLLAQDIFWKMRARSNVLPLLFKRTGLWEDLAKSFEGYEQRPAPMVDMALLRSKHAAFAWRFGKFEEAVRLLDALGPQVKQEAFNNFDTTPADVRNESAARSGPDAKVANAAGEAEAGGNFDLARFQFDALVKKTDPATPAGRYARQHQMTNWIADHLESQQAAPIAFENDQSVIPFYGDLKPWAVKDSELICTASFGETMLMQRLRSPLAFRMRFEWNWSSSDPKVTPVIGVVLQQSGPGRTAVLKIEPARSRVHVDMGGMVFRDAPGTLAPETMAAGAWHTMEIERQLQDTRVKLDGTVLTETGAGGMLMAGRPRFGFTVIAPAEGVTVKFRNLVIEPLPGSKVAPEKP